MYLVILAGAILAPFAIYQYIEGLGGFAIFSGGPPTVDLSTEAIRMVCLVFLCALCRSIPIYLSDQRALDISVVSILTTVLTQGVYAAVVVFLASSLFVLDYDKERKRYNTLYNTPFVKNAFNNANLTITILLAGWLYSISGGAYRNPVIPEVIWPTTVFSIASFFLNANILIVLFFLNKQITPSDWIGQMRGLIPNVLLAMPLGLFMALLFVMNNGHWLAMLMLFPLLLARYAWSLYVDSQNQHMKLMQAFISAMEAKDTYTEGHSRRVEAISVKLAQTLRLPPYKIKEIKTAALLHDIGKIGIEDAIIRKPAALTDEERKRIEEHPAIGVNIIEKVELSDAIKEMVRHHHEWYNGGGYPDGVDYTTVSFETFILGVADAFDAMTSDRPYRKGMSYDEAMSRLGSGVGKQFHPAVVEAMSKCLDDIPNPSNPTMPELPV